MVVVLVIEEQDILGLGYPRHCDLLTRAADANESGPDLDLSFFANGLFYLLDSNVFGSVISGCSHFDSIRTLIWIISSQ